MSFSEEQVAFRDNLRRMVARHVAPIAAEIDETDRFPLELVKLFGEMGLMQLWVPERYGGPNGNLTMACIAREEISKVSPACASIAALNTMFIMPLLHFGSEEQRQKYLPIIAKGGVVTAIAISEPQAGSDVAALNARARKDGDSYVLNGRKQWCSYGVVADYIVVMARTSDGAGADGISAFIVEPKKMPGITFGRHERKMGFRGAPNTPIFFDNVRVPAENLVGEEGKGFRASMRALDLNRPTIGAQSVGLAQGALDACVAYAKERKQFKQPIAEFQGVQFMLADMAMQIEAARALVYECARAGRCRRLEAAQRACQHGQMRRQRHGHEGDDRRGPDLRRLRLHHGLPGRTHDARRQADPDLRRHQPDPARGDRPRAAALAQQETNYREERP
ncbi:alkylation response protein AidB-like acyl-CoA dehydrogenase [Bradyrhizobium sp. USDA 3240]